MIGDTNRHIAILWICECCITLVQCNSWLTWLTYTCTSHLRSDHWDRLLSSSNRSNTNGYTARCWNRALQGHRSRVTSLADRSQVAAASRSGSALQTVRGMSRGEWSECSESSSTAVMWVTWRIHNVYNRLAHCWLTCVRAANRSPRFQKIGLARLWSSDFASLLWRQRRWESYQNCHWKVTVASTVAAPVAAQEANWEFWFH